VRAKGSGVVSAATPPLGRRIGWTIATSVVVANMIGSGIFTVSGFLARDLGDPWWILAAWLVGGVIALSGALAYAGLGVTFPFAGGDYVFLREAYGPLLGFLTGWMSFFIGFSAPIAAGAIGAVEYLSGFFPSLATQSAPALLSLFGIKIAFSPGHALAIVIILFLSLAHYVGLRVGGSVQVGLTSIKIGALVAMIALGLWIGDGDWSHFSRPDLSGPAPGLFAVSLIFVMFSYSGWNAAVYIAEEIRDPERNLPRALLWGTGFVTVLYVGLNVVFIYALSVSDMGGVLRIGDAAAQALFGSGLPAVLTTLFIVSILASMSSMIFAGPRVYFAMARDGLFFGGAARVHPVFSTPGRAIWLQAAWASVLVITGTFDQLLTYAGFALVLFSAIAVGAVFRLHRRGALAYHGVGFPWTPSLFLVASAWMMGYTLWTRPVVSLLGVLLVALGVPVYFYFRGRGRYIGPGGRERSRLP
jgi:APA family basic amino acid/polyamine antiporter